MVRLDNMFRDAETPKRERGTRNESNVTEVFVSLRGRLLLTMPPLSPHGKPPCAYRSNLLSHFSVHLFIYTCLRQEQSTNVEINQNTIPKLYGEKIVLEKYSLYTKLRMVL